MYVLLLCLVHLGNKLLGQRLAVDLHGIAIAAAANGDVRERLSRLVPLTRQSCDYARRRIVLVQRRAQLLSCLCQLLFEGVCLEYNGVPLILEGAEKRRDRGEVRRPRADDLRRLELDQILDGQVFTGDRICVVFGDVRLDQALFENIAALARCDGFPWSFSRYGAKHCGGCGEIGASSDALQLGVAQSRFLKTKRANAQNGKRHLLYSSAATHHLSITTHRSSSLDA